MNIVYTFAFAIFLVFLIIYFTKYKITINIKNRLLFLLLISVVVRIFALKIDAYNETDINCFKSWSIMLFENGFSQFYTLDAFTDYPPGYMYILYLLGFIQNTFKLDYFSTDYTLLIKSPAIIFDIISVAVIYKLATKHINKNNAFLCALAYSLNPAVIINSAVWGQVDSIYSLFILLSIYMLTQKNYFISFLIFTVAVLIKPQAFIFSPIYMFGAYNMLSHDNFSKNSIKKLSLYAIACLCLLFILILPFAPNLNFTYVYKQYVDTLTSYPYASLNAYNFYSFIDANWVNIDQKFLFIPFSLWGTLFIVFIVLLSLYLLNKFNFKGNYFFVAGLINAFTFMFSVKMHERYLYPSILLFLFAYIYSRNKYLLFLVVGFSLTLFINCADVLNMLMNGNNLYYLQNTIKPISAINLILIFATIFLGFISFKCEQSPIDEEQEISNDLTINKVDLELNETPIKFNVIDAFLLGILVIAYSVIAFTNLGNIKSPQTMWTASSEDVIVDLGSVTNVSEIAFITGPKEDRAFSIYSSTDNLNWELELEINKNSVFEWKFINLNTEARYFKISDFDYNLMILEMAFLYDGKVLDIDSHLGGENLFDEQHLVPTQRTYLNSTYFDEIYHARTGYEFVHSMPVYEWTHPPLGKVFIALGIQLFGMTPFGFRFMGTLFGVLMLPLLYAFAKTMFRSSYWAFFCTFIFCFDFMHFAQTRIATIDTYVTFFIIGMFYFMYKYYCSSFYYTPIKKTLIPLLFSGIFFGLAVASKWPGLYAGVGLCVIFFYTIYKRYLEYKYNKNTFEFTHNFKKYSITTFAFCVLFFVIIPLTIYVTSYIPYLKTPNMDGISSIIQNQKNMYNYHSNLVSEHPFSSPWWKWIIDLRPIFYYVNTVNENIKSGISSFGNPAVWWAGAVCVFYALVKKQKDKVLIFLIIAYAAQLLPWVLVSRTTYIYHYFPSVPFITLIITYFFKNYIHYKSKYLTYSYMAIVLLLFIIFYPVISGADVDYNYVKKYLEWLPTWQLI